MIAVLQSTQGSKGVQLYDFTDWVFTGRITICSGTTLERNLVDTRKIQDLGVVGFRAIGADARSEDFRHMVEKAIVLLEMMCSQVGDRNPPPSTFVLSMHRSLMLKEESQLGCVA